MKCKLTKLSDNPNALRTNEVIGNFEDKPKVGEGFFMTAEALTPGMDWREVWTSRVTKIVSDNEQETVFHTLNSTYKVEYLDKIDKVKENLCPTCNEESTLTCRCPRRDSCCKNGHTWHTCTVHHVLVIGGSDHGTNTFSCTCLRKGDKDGNRNMSKL